MLKIHHILCLSVGKKKKKKYIRIHYNFCDFFFPPSNDKKKIYIYMYVRVPINQILSSSENNILG